jgi:AraC-like DNA-binding protein
MLRMQTNKVDWLLRDQSSEHVIPVSPKISIKEANYRGTVERLPVGDTLVVYLGTIDVLAPCTLEPRVVETEPWMCSSLAVNGRLSIELSDGARVAIGPDRAALFRSIDGFARYEHPPQHKLRMAGYRLRGDRVARYFDGAVPRSLATMLDAGMARGQAFEIPATPRMRRAGFHLFSEQFNGALRLAYLEGVVLQLFAMQAAAASGERAKFVASRRDWAIIREARERLLVDLRNPPSTAALALAVGVSEKTLNAGFRSLFGTTVFETLRNERLDHARIVLETTDVSLKEIANRVGYNQVSNFTTAFTVRFGAPPRRYMRTRAAESE